MTFDKKIEIALDRIKIHCPPDGYYLAFSGGKDSCVIKALADMAKVKYDAHYSVTTIDPPPVVYFIRKHHPDVIWDRPEVPLLKKLVSKGFPLRQSRWCCELYKENGGWGRTVLLGLRAAESLNRSKRPMVEDANNMRLYKSCYKNPIGKKLVSPIIDWLDKDVWQFIGKFNIPYCTLYDEGSHRVGCLMCPMAQAKHRLSESVKYPSFTQTFIRAFEALYADRMATGRKSVKRWSSGREMFYWWLTGKVPVPGGDPAMTCFYSTRFSKEPSPYFRSFEAMLTYIRTHHVSGPFNYWTGSHEAPIPYTPEIPF